MAHFAKIENNTVTSVIVVSNENCGGGEFPQSEPVGQTFIASLGLTGDWLQCSYHNNFRGCWVQAGYTFDPLLGEYGEFVQPWVEPIQPIEP